MSYYVYILRSAVDNTCYKGFTTDYLKRLGHHNSGMSVYTRNKVPWKFVYIEKLSDKRTALIRERALKKYSHAQIELIMKSSKNILGHSTV